ncbi:hypothetical protein [Chondrinema litorale]|uniref:hypothetical protein n=1 Tax=Chondrinema litorale TaxID=2994555 RepID=UPI0025429B0B|nr:hypothetical protein [Chondrinema litorale]UZR99124.1 hypothetical protein OQ292_35225 [Chondrinema litorale]
MEERYTQLKSIWGKWWEPIRKYFYPAWLIYETTVRFYEYSEATYLFFITENYIGELGSQSLAMFCSIATFVICSFFLTLPACFIFYKFFKLENLSGTQFESKIKKFF